MVAGGELNKLNGKLVLEDQRMVRPVRWGMILGGLLLLSLIVSWVPPVSAHFPGDNLPDETLPATKGGLFGVGDFNSDGENDVLTWDAETTGKLRVYSGRDQSVMSSFPLAYLTDLAVGSWDEDAYSDLVVLQGGTAISAYPGGPSGLPSEPTKTYQLSGGYHRISLGDMDGDGDQDIVAIGSERFTTILLATDKSPGAEDRRVFSWHDVGPGEVMALGEITGDGKTDAVLTDGVDLALCSLAGNATAVTCVTGPVGNDGPWEARLALGDYDSDRDLDVLFLQSDPLLSRSGRLSVIYNNYGESGEGGLSAPQVLLGGRYRPALAVLEFTEDRHLDVALVNWTGSVLLVPQGRDGRLEAPSVSLTRAPPSMPDELRFERVDADPYPDLIVLASDLAIYYGANRPPLLVEEISSDWMLEPGGSADDLIDLRDYFRDDHGVLRFVLIKEENPAEVDAVLDGPYLDFRALGGFYGKRSFQVAAYDDSGYSAVLSNEFAVHVNAAPRWTGERSLSLGQGERVRIPLSVEDPYPSADHARFVLLEGPGGLEVDPSATELRWEPDRDQVGSHALVVRVVDDYGGSTLVQLELVVESRATSFPWVAPVTGGIVLVGVLGTSLVLFDETSRWRLLLLLAPLYTKIRREQVLDHFTRGQIYGYIQANPGEHFTAIRKALQLTNGAIAYHLRTLERENFIRSRRFGLYRRYYPFQMRIPENGYLTINAIQRTIVRTVTDRPGISQKEIANLLNLTPPTINYHVNHLANRNLLRVEKVGRATRCFVETYPPMILGVVPES